MNKILPYIALLTSFILAGTAAFFSIFGLSQLFSGAATAVIIMAATIELGKLITVSVLYRSWSILNKILRVYLYIGAIVMILITSVGIYGFLSSAYSEVSNKVSQVDKEVEMLTYQRNTIAQDIEYLKKNIETSRNRIEVLTNTRSSREDRIDNALETNTRSSRYTARRTENSIKDLTKEIEVLRVDINTFQSKIDAKNDEIKQLDLQILQLNSNASLRDIGPLKYIAKLVNRPVDNIVNYLIIVLIFVFDPLAIALLIAANTMFENTKDDREPLLPKPDSDVKESEIIDDNELDLPIMDFNPPRKQLPEEVIDKWPAVIS